VAVDGAPLGLVGAGTGLGVSGLIPGKDGWTALLSEGGHVTFAPANALEVAILQYAWKEFEHVSAERLISGVGIELIYRALAHHTDMPAEPLAAAEISRRALAGECTLCDETIEAFCCMLGTVASNLATPGRAGRYLYRRRHRAQAGCTFRPLGFPRPLRSQGRFSNYLAQVPTWVITAEYPAFVGVFGNFGGKTGYRLRCSEQP
jgi:glucokinase